MKNLSIFSFLILTILILSSCEKPDPFYANTNEDNDIYVSNHSKDVSFADYKYYVIGDSVANVSNDINSSSASASQTDKQVISTIKSEMAKMGFILGVNPAPASGKNDTEIVVTVSKANFTATIVGGYYPYYGYGGYYGYPYYGYGWGYYYPPYYYSYDISGGFYYIDLVDLKNIIANQALSVVWAGYIAGSNPTVNTQTRAVNGVKTLFAQSPYLHDGK